MKPEDFKAFVYCRKDKEKTAFLDAAETDRFTIVESLLETYDAEYRTTDDDQYFALNRLEQS